MKNSKIYPCVVVGLLWGVALLNYMDRQMSVSYTHLDVYKRQEPCNEFISYFIIPTYYSNSLLRDNIQAPMIPAPVSYTHL